MFQSELESIGLCCDKRQAHLKYSLSFAPIKTTQIYHTVLRIHIHPQVNLMKQNSHIQCGLSLINHIVYYNNETLL